MSYEEILKYLYDQLPMFHRIGPAAYKPDLDNTIQLLELFGNPQQSLKTVHVAGTNGKGSTSHLIASSLQEAGYKTGLYTSPHLLDFRERIKINGSMIPKEAVVQFIENYLSLKKELKPSFFELTVAMCFWYFEKEKTDIAVIETGLGGRLDSTNVILPEISVITTIGFDHMNLLGETLEKIAFEKAGIIKENTPLIIGNIVGSPKEIIDQQAIYKKANIHSVSMNSDAPASSLKGNYQEENRRTAYLTLKILRNDLGWNIPEESITNGFAHVVENTGIMGRWQILQNDPLVIVDVAHNEDGIKEIVRQIEECTFHHLHFVLGMVNDKDIGKVLSLLPKHASYYFCKANIPRGMDASLLADLAKKFNLNGVVCHSVKEAFKLSLQAAGPKDLVFVGGSFFTVAEVLDRSSI